MFGGRLLLTSVLVSFLFGFVATEARTQGAPEFVPGEILVKFKPSLRTAMSEAQAMLESRSLERFGAMPARELRLGRRDRTGRWVKLVSERLRSDGMGTHELLAELRRNPAVEYAELNVYLTAQHFPNDPYFASSSAWGQDFPDLWGLGLMGAETAWDSTQGVGVVVAVIDTGIDDAHEDLSLNVFRNPGEVGLDVLGRDRRTNAIDDDGNGFVDDWRGWNFIAGTNDSTDDHGHGTHVAGTIAAVSDNGLGIVGVAPHAKVLAVKALNQFGFGTLEQVSEAIRYAADAGAAVINLSLGASGKTPQSLRDAVDYAHDVKGVVVVAAAGNNNADVGLPGEGFFPANLRDVIAVSAFDHRDRKASFSNYGPKIDVAAPGGGGSEPAGAYDPHRSVLSLRASRAGASMTGSGQLVVGTSYLRQAGTSMAAPHAAGVAALVKSLRPAASPEEVRQSLRAGSDDVGTPGFDSQSGYGRLNAAGALSENPLAAQLTHPSVSVSAAEIVQVRGSAGGPGFASWHLQWGAGPSPSTWQPIVSSTTPVTNGLLAEWNLSGVGDGTHMLRLIATSTSGREYEDRMPLVVDSLVITEPSLEEIPLVGPGQPVSIRGTVEPSNFLRFTMRATGRRTGAVDDSRFTLTGGGLATVRNGLVGTWDPAGLPADHYTLNLIVEVSPFGVIQETTRVIYDPRLHPGWPVDIGNIGSGGVSLSLSDHLTAADVNLDGKAEILIAYGRQVHVLDEGGRELPGWPQTVGFEGTTFQGGVAAGDLTGDGVPEIVAATYQGDLHVWSAEGALVSGWPRFTSGSRFVAIDDIDSDGTNEIVTTGSNYVDVVDVNGQHLPGFPLPLGGMNPAAIGDLDGDGSVELVVASQSAPGPVFAISNRGGILPGWPRDINPGAPTQVLIRAYPALGDLDGDGDLEIVVNGRAGQVFAFHHDGSDVDGWPQLTEPVIVNPPALGDLDGDGRPEVIAGASTVYEPSRAANYLYAWHGDGTPVSGWPVQHAELISSTYFGFGAPVVADLEGDGLADVFASSDTYYSFHFALNGFHGDGTRLEGFPRPTKQIGAAGEGTAAIADVDGDGLLEMAWLDSDKRLYLWDFDAPVSASQLWPMYRGNSGHSGRIAGADFLRIDGRVFDHTGRGVPGVWVSATGTVARGAVTDANGEYALTRLVAFGDYTVTPSLDGVTFTPPSATFSDLQSDARQDFEATGEADVVFLELTVTGLENGEGSVFLDPPGTNCANFGMSVVRCPESFARDTIVTALATPAPGSKFLGWYGACQGTGPCQASMITDTFLDAQFLGPQELVVVLDGFENGSGSVLIDPAGTSCDLMPGAPNQVCSTFLPPDTLVTLEARAALDAKFLGWSGACSGTDVCQVMLADAQTVYAMFMGPQELVLVLDGLENGQGSVDIVPPGTNCDLVGAPNRVCSTFLRPDTLVTLTATTSPDSTFLGWSGACFGMDVCQVTLADSQTVYAMFMGPQELVVVLDGFENGEGSVDIVPPGTSCDLVGVPNRVCSTFLRPDTLVTLEARAAPDSKFLGWGGACSGFDVCQVTLADTQTVYAMFMGPQELVVVLDGLENGQGFVDIVPPGTPCDLFGAPNRVCSTFLRPDTLVTLTATAAPDSKFLGWSGACVGRDVCQVMLADAQTVYAMFLGPQELIVALSGLENGSGRVSLDPPGTTCEVGYGVPNHACSTFLPPDTVVALTPYPVPGAVFLGWGGACSGIGACSVTVSGRTEVLGGFGIDNRPPIAEAGVSRTIELGFLAVLNGTLSYDPDGDQLSFLWTDSAGSPVGTEPVISLSLPLGTHRFNLFVSDPKAAFSEDFVDISVVDTTPPSVELILPVEGPVPEGRPLAIEWTAADIGQLSRFDLFHSSDGGGSYAPIAECEGLPPAARSCTWSSPGPASPDARLRLVAFDLSGNQNAFEVALSILRVRSVSLRIAVRNDDVEENASGKMALGDDDLDLSESFVGLRYVNVPIPRGATILGARVELTARASRSSATTLTIRGQASDNAAAFSTASRNLTSRPLTSASALWNPSPWIVRSLYGTPDIRTILQEIVNRAGWQSGRALVLSFSRGSGKREASSSNYRSAEAPVLRVEYMDPEP